jgi:hypothetical protein
MHMALIIAAFVFALTLLACAITVFAQGMADAADTHTPPVYTVFIAGTAIALGIAGTHWLPHVAW